MIKNNRQGLQEKDIQHIVTKNIIPHTMDYMNLGTKSRKTGISVREDIAKDEFDMENIDEFFNDNASIASTKKKHTSSQSPRRQQQQRLLSSRTKQSRRQSSLFQFNNNNELSSPHIMSPSIRRTSMSKNNSSYNFTSDMLHSIREEGGSIGEYQPAVRTKKKQRLNNSSALMANYKTSYGISVTPTTNGSVTSHNQSPLMLPNESHGMDTESVKYNIKREDNNSLFNYDSNPYLQDDDEESNEAPDLTVHELTVDNTSLVTSDDARFEDEASAHRSSESEFSSNEEDNEDIIEDNIMLQQEEDGDVDATYIPSSPISNTHLHNQIVEEEHNETEPIRKSDRIKIPTLDYWRNEKIVYQRKTQFPAVDVVKVVTYDDDKPFDLKDNGREDNRLDNTTEIEYDSDTPNDATAGQAPRTYKNYSRLKKDVVKDTRNGSWLRDGEFKANVFKSKKSSSLINETVAYAPGTYQMEKLKQNDTEKYSLAVTFDKYKDHFASGMLKLPVDGKRTTTNSQNAFITFYMIRGILEVTLNKQKFIVTSGSTFQVPAFNRYAFKNKGFQEVQLFFVQVIVPENFNQSPKKKNSKKDTARIPESHKVSPASSSSSISTESSRLSSE